MRKIKIFFVVVVVVGLVWNLTFLGVYEILCLVDQ
jgi:hypothetical protein